jgi:hypothetical protein
MKNKGKVRSAAAARRRAFQRRIDALLDKMLADLDRAPSEEAYRGRIQKRLELLKLWRPI